MLYLFKLIKYSFELIRHNTLFFFAYLQFFFNFKSLLKFIDKESKILNTVELECAIKNLETFSKNHSNIYLTDNKKCKKGGKVF